MTFKLKYKFNEYFTRIGYTLASKIPQRDGNHIEFIMIIVIVYFLIQLTSLKIMSSMI